MKTITKIILWLGVCAPVTAAPIADFGFKSPAFNGSGYSSHVLTVENQEYTRKQAIAKEIQAALDKAAADAKNTNLQKFLNNLESRVYATLSQKIAEQLFKQDGNTSGTFDVAGNHIAWSSDGGTISLSITDPAGKVTEVEVPYGSLAW